MNEQRQRLRVVIRGAVQGVGFRPFVYRLAGELGLAGWVCNSAQGVFIEAEGRTGELEQFLLRLDRERPPHAFIQSLESSYLEQAGYGRFEIRPSLAGEKTALVLPDIATCPECLREVLDPANRRHLYPFTNCTHCGPRFSIIESLPYDRPGTTMRGFVMCEACRKEYEDPGDRRFHAQPNACPACGPQLELWDKEGKVLATRHDALLAAAGAIRAGKIVAVKGLGGFHLMVDATNEEAVRELRRRKGREEKPLALMAPSLESVRKACEVSESEARLLGSPEAPIVLLRRKQEAVRPLQGREVSGAGSPGFREYASPGAIQIRPLRGRGNVVAPPVAPGNPYLGVMLPYTPLHHLLLAELGRPVVATSGNLSDEPICTDEREALVRLGGIADLFLVHNRPIARHVDDSIVRVAAGREQVLRRARGFAPLPIQVGEPLPAVLAVGAHLKNTVAIAIGRQVFISQHIGDLETAQAYEAFERVIARLGELYDFHPVAVACDAHPDYLSTRFARGLGLPVVAVQHHAAHVLGCMAENEVAAPALGVAWDGTGWGDDGTVWGGEFLRVTESGIERAAHLRTFMLPGGERAIREPRRAALGLLYEMFGARCFESEGPANQAIQSIVDAFEAREIGPLRKMLAGGINSPRTSSAGRLFDAAAALVGLSREMAFEGQAAMALEFALDGLYGCEGEADNENKCNENKEHDGWYDFVIADGQEGAMSLPLVLDWTPMMGQLIKDVQGNIPVGRISRKFHNTLAEMIVAVALRIGEERVVLTGGCFQNKYLLERTVHRLSEAGFQPFWHQRIPPNDGGIALGQAVAAARRKE